jgi:hypothetical protein
MKETKNINLHPLPLNSKKNQPTPFPSPFNIYIKTPDPPSLATQQWKNSFKKKNNPLPFFLPHVKWRRKKKNINLYPPSPSKVKEI